ARAGARGRRQGGPAATQLGDDDGEGQEHEGQVRRRRDPAERDQRDPERDGAQPGDREPHLDRIVSSHGFLLGTSHPPHQSDGLRPSAPSPTHWGEGGVGRSGSVSPVASRRISGGFSTRGRLTRKTAPPPGRFSAQIRPPWASTIPRQTVSPSPTPRPPLGALPG